MATKRFTKGKIAAGVTVCTLGAAAAGVGIYFGTRGSDSGSLRGSNSSAGPGQAVIAKCGELQVYSKAANNKLDGTFTNFAYGPTNAECCSAEYECPYAAVATYACDGGASTIYEMQCCTKRPVGGDFTSCGDQVYRATVPRASTAAGRALATGQDCQSTGFETVSTCSARPANRGLETLLFDSLLAPNTPNTPTTRPVDPATEAPVDPVETEAPVTEAPATEAPVTEEPVVTPAPTMAPTTVMPVVVVPDAEKCVQADAVPPPGVKPGGCLQVMCVPKAIGIDQDFHMTVRFCVQRPRRAHLSFDMLDRISKEFFVGDGWNIAGDVQCGEHTFSQNLKIKNTPGEDYPDVMWKWFVTPIWGPDGNEIQDTFPNMLSETGIGQQPDYTQLVEDCPIVPDRTWNLPATGMQDAIDFEQLPECVTPGQPWTVQIKTHLESRAVVDFHVNLQIGTGGDKYLGADDIFVAESNDNYWAMPKNAANEYWTVKNYTFTAAQTGLLKAGDRVYISAFMTPQGELFETNGAWTILERESYLSLSTCA